MLPDIPTLMEINYFKSRFDLLLEKAQLKENDFQGNEYTEYGNLMEPKIRDYINETLMLAHDPFIPTTKIDGDIRVNTDGTNEEMILEIKTTSQIKKTILGYKTYLVQLLFSMDVYKKKKGLLVVYHRTSFDPILSEDKIQLFEVDINDYQDLLNEIKVAVNRFRNDLEIIKDNPFISEVELNEI